MGNRKTAENSSSEDRLPRKKPYILVYGDDDIKSVTKAVWSATSAQDITVYQPENIQELEKKALDAVLVVIYVNDENDPRCKLSAVLWRNPMVVCDVVGISEDLSLEERVSIMAFGFDNMFNTKSLHDPKFQESLRNKVEKGRIRLNNRFQEQEYKRFKAALAASPDAFIVFDNDKKVFFVSEHYKSVYPANTEVLKRGTPVEEAFEHLSAAQNVVKGDPRYETFKKFWIDLAGQIEFTLDNGRTWRVKASQLSERQGTIVTTTDITDYLEYQRLLEEKSEALEEALEKEKEASEVQKQFINMVSHEFRTPLTIIDGNAQIIQKRGETLDPETLAKRSKSIRSAVSRLIYMMEGILSSNMLNTGKMNLMVEEMDLRKLIEELTEEQELLSPSLSISLDLEQLPKTLPLDRKVMTLCLTNLISNAMKFSENHPEILISASVEQATLFLEVEDKGIGIPEDEIDKIFDRYYRSSLSKSVTGSGIGLNLVKGLIDLHGGTISVKSVPGDGTVFAISISVAG